MNDTIDYTEPFSQMESLPLTLLHHLHVLIHLSTRTVHVATCVWVCQSFTPPVDQGSSFPLEKMMLLALSMST